jgi:hypothetical protein
VKYSVNHHPAHWPTTSPRNIVGDGCAHECPEGPCFSALLLVMPGCSLWEREGVLLLGQGIGQRVTYSWLARRWAGNRPGARLGRERPRTAWRWVGAKVGESVPHLRRRLPKASERVATLGTIAGSPMPPPGFDTGLDTARRFCGCGRLELRRRGGSREVRTPGAAPIPRPRGLPTPDPLTPPHVITV